MSATISFVVRDRPSGETRLPERSAVVERDEEGEMKKEQGRTEDRGVGALTKLLELYVVHREASGGGCVVEG